jgi:large subunit ribosomal protein L25
MITSSLSATTRDRLGKGPSRQMRRLQGHIPAVVYGRGRQNAHVALDPDALRTALRTELRRNTLIKLTIDDGREERLVVVKDYQTHPVFQSRLLHIDFLEIEIGRPMTFQVPVEIVGIAAGVKVGGILEVKRRALTVHCLPDKLPPKVEVDVSALEVGGSIHVADLKLPEGVDVKFETNFTVAVVTAPPAAAEEAKVEEVAEGAEGAVEAAEGGETAEKPKKAEKGEK